MSNPGAPIPVFCVTDFWFPKFGGMERSIDNLCRGLPPDFQPRICTPQPGGGPPDCPYPVSRFRADPVAGYYGGVLAEIERAPAPRIVHVFGFSFRWPEAQARFIRAAAAVAGTAVVMKVPTQGDARNYLTTTHAGIAGSVDRFVALTGDLAGELSACGVSPERIAHLPNGVDTNRFLPATGAQRAAARAPLALPPRRLVFGFCGRFEERKRVDLLAAAVRRQPDADRPILLLIGETDRTFGAGVEIEGMLDDDIRWVPPQADMRPLYRALDVYATMSAREGMSNAVLEAISSGLPVVASDIPGHRELVRHGEYGLLVEGGGTGELERAIATVTGIWRSGRLPEWGEAARRASLQFDMQAICRRYAEMYRGLAAAPPS